MIKYKGDFMARVALVVFSMLLSVISIGCSDSPDKGQESRGVKPGEYYSFQSEDGGYKVLKILLVEESLIHVCFYNNNFKGWPKEDVIESLYFGEKSESLGGSYFSREGELTTTGRKHFALTSGNWELWEPRFLVEGEVASDELVAYEEWKNGDRSVPGLSIPIN